MKKLLFFFVISIIMLSSNLYANDIITADLSKKLVKVTTKYSGAELLLFGAMEEKGDILLIVKGPEKNYKIRKKIKKAGIWLNKEETTIKKQPSFYYIASSFEPKKEILKENSLYKKLIKNMLRDNKLLVKNYKTIEIIEDKLFRTNIKLPPNAPLGDYLVEVSFIKDDIIINKEIFPLKISQVGTEARLAAFSHNNPFIYGIICVLMAIAVGLCANRIFNKR